MRKTLPFFVVLFLFLASTSLVFAQDATSSTTSRERLLPRVASKVASREAVIKEKVAIRKDNLALKLEERKARIASNEAELKQRLQSFRDKNKAQVIERINTQLATVNEKRTDSMSAFLTRLENLLAKIETRTTEAGNNGKDITAVNQAIADAKTAIEEAKSAVSLQADKTYVITISSETQARADVKTVRDLLHTDLFETNKLVVEAKQSVGKILQTAKSTLGGNQ